jgi:hypothetical protein
VILSVREELAGPVSERWELSPAETFRPGDAAAEAVLSSVLAARRV